MSGNTLSDKLQAVFAMYPDKDKIYAVSDGRMFFTEQEADSYAQKLPDSTVTPYDRNPVEEVEKPAGGEGSAEDKAKEEAPAPKKSNAKTKK
jgi:hypothetical protein